MEDIILTMNNFGIGRNKFWMDSMRKNGLAIIYQTQEMNPE